MTTFGWQQLKILALRALPAYRKNFGRLPLNQLSMLPQNHVENGNDGAELLHSGLRQAGVVDAEDHDVQDHADDVNDDGEPNQLLRVGADYAQ